MDIIKLLEEEINSIPLDSIKVKNTLEPNIWIFDNGDYILKPEIIETLTKSANYFIEILDISGLNLPEVPIVDLTLTGSLANYNWSNYSDYDVHIVVDTSNINSKYLDLFLQYTRQAKLIFDKTQNIKVYNYPVEVYVEDSNDAPVSTGIYSLMNNKWIIKPEHMSGNIDKSIIKMKTLSIMKSIDSIIISSKPETADFVKLLTEAKDLWKRLKDMRQAGLDTEGELSNENLVYKMLRRNGYIEKLFELRATLIDKKLSI